MAGSTRTFEGWAYRNNTTVAHAIMGGSGANGPMIALRLNLNDFGWWPDASAGGIWWTSAAPVGQWFHWALTYNDTTRAAELFVNGLSEGTQTAPNGYGAVPGNMRWGKTPTALPFDGKLDEVAVYSGALSAARILAHYRAGDPYRAEVAADAPSAYWRMGETVGAVAYDSAGSANGTYFYRPAQGASGGLLTDTNTGATFNGSTQFVTAPSSAALDLGNGPFTLEAWVKRGSTGGVHTILDKGSSAYKLYLTGDKVTLRANGPGRHRAIDDHDRGDDPLAPRSRDEERRDVQDLHRRRGPPGDIDGPNPCRQLRGASHRRGQRRHRLLQRHDRRRRRLQERAELGRRARPLPLRASLPRSGPSWTRPTPTGVWTTRRAPPWSTARATAVTAPTPTPPP